MPVLDNPRHERLALALFEAINGSRPDIRTQGQAYVAAGYRAKDAGVRGGSAEAAASRLLNKVKPIGERVRELQASVARRKKVTLESIVDELEQAREIALEAIQPSAMVAATSQKAKVLGLSVERVEQGKPGDFSGIETIEGGVTALLRAHNVPDSAITDDMRASVAIELERHSVALAAIIDGSSAQDGLASH